MRQVFEGKVARRAARSAVERGRSAAKRGRGVAKLLNKIAAVGVTVAMAVILLPAAPAAAHGTCWNWSCDGKDPALYDCPASTYAEFYFSPATYEMRRSTSCSTVWTRIKSPRTVYGDIGMINTYNCSDAKTYCRVGYFLQRTAEGASWTAMMATAGTQRWFKTCMSYHDNHYPDICTQKWYLNA